MDVLPTPRRSLFAVWHWPRWTWAIVAVLMMVGYVLSPPITVQLAIRGRLPSNIARNIRVLQLPLFVAVRDVQFVSALYQAESDLLDERLGKTRSSISWTKGHLEIITRADPSDFDNPPLPGIGDAESIAPSPVPVLK